MAVTERTIVFYESPHRIMKTLEALLKFLSPTQMVHVSREITKIHEEHVAGTAAEVLKHYTAHPDRVRGEFVVTVAAH
jgi:16S rRNA (cytidine1402-2'-O)-methyltransferase